MNACPRVAFFPDTFHEVNGVALTSRQFDAFARRRELPFLNVHCGPKAELRPGWLELRRSAAAFHLDSNLLCDPLLIRHARLAGRALHDFRPDVIHVTGPGDTGLLGLYLSRKMRIPLVASWHTSLHEYAGMRLERMFSFLSEASRNRIARLAEREALRAVNWFYRSAKVLLAPNQEIVRSLREETGKPVFLMQRGVDTSLFSPRKRTRCGGPFTMGFVGRLTPEKGVRLLAQIERALENAGRRSYRFLIVGEGSEQPWLREHLRQAEFTGVLKGEPLAEAYANMDLFVFPSTTDTFGNVILEAMASGVPAVVTAEGGPKFLVQSGVTGYVAADERSFIKCVASLAADLDAQHRMGEAARHYASTLSWDSVFEKVYGAYESCLQYSGSHAQHLSRKLA